MQPLLNAVKAALIEAGLYHSGVRLLCAVSGGADSVALLHALCRLRNDAGYTLEAVHVQHGLRGESSLADEQFVRGLCARLNVPLHVERAGLTGGMDDPGAETRARESRRRIFAVQMGRAFHGRAAYGASSRRPGRNGAHAPAARRGSRGIVRHAAVRRLWTRRGAAALSEPLQADAAGCAERGGPFALRG